jgi:hypothetical protein
MQVYWTTTFIIVSLAPQLSDFSLRPQKGDLGLGGEIRTPDPLYPKQMRYRTALHRVISLYLYIPIHNQTLLTAVIYDATEYSF